jgi:Leucine rich repeat
MWTSVGSSLYTCNNPSITSFEVKKSLETVIGVHQFGKNNSDVDALNVKEQELTEIPPNMKDFFPNLRAILLYKTNLRTISPDDLPFPLLEYFSSMFNKIHSIDGELFKNTPMLKEVSFNGNLLEHVGENIFKGLSELTRVDFRGNSCVDLWTRTEEELEQLSEKLLVDCKCSNRCSLGDEIDEMNFVVDELSRKAKKLTSKIATQETFNNDLRKIATESSAKILELEKLVKEFGTSQCGSSNLSVIIKVIFFAFMAIFILIVLCVIVIFCHRKFYSDKKPFFGPNR